MRFAAFFLNVALGACPREFRRAYRGAVHADFSDRLHEETERHGRLGASAYALSAYLDVIAAGLRERAAMIARDILYTLRSLRRTPLFTAVVITTLGIAIAANAAVFSILDGVLLKPLPYADPASLVSVAGLDDRARLTALSYPNFVDLRAQSRTLSDMAAVEPRHATLSGHGPPRALVGQGVTASFFRVFGIQPFAGRFFTDADAKPGAAHALVVSHELYVSVFGGDPSIIGMSVLLDGTPNRIIGVAPASMRGPERGGFSDGVYWQIIQPSSATGEDQRDEDFLLAYGRLRPRVSLAAAQTDLRNVMARLAIRYVDSNKHLSASVIALNDDLLGPVQPLLFGVFAAVAGVLLVACANVANLLLSRAAVRERELAVRFAVGASRARIVAQILTETLLFAFAGGALGLLLAALTVRGFLELKPPGIPRLDTVTFDGTAALFTFGVVVFCTLAAGLVPALLMSRQDLGDALKAAGRGGDRNRGARARAAFVVAEIAMTLALVAASGLVFRSFMALTATPLGFEAHGVSTIRLASLPEQRYGGEARLIAFERRAIERERAVPGVGDAAWAAFAPFDHVYTVAFDLPDRPLPPGESFDADFDIVSSGYFDVLHIPLVRGRLFDDGDRRGTTPVVIVSETFARTFFGSASPLGKRITPGLSAGSGAAPTRTIVGVAADIRARYAQAPRPEIYFPDSQIAMFSNGTLLVRAQPGVDGAQLAGAIAAIDPDLVPSSVEPLTDALARDAARARLSALALGTLALIALLLSTAGIYAVVSYAVTQRTREFGIRKALGARGGHVLGDVLVRSARLTAIGIALGLICAVFAARLIAAQLYDVGPADTVTYLAVIAVLFAAALSAALIPALRAMRVDPVIALRYE